MPRAFFLPLFVLITTSLFVAQAPSVGAISSASTASVEGYVRSARGMPVANANVQVRALRTDTVLSVGTTRADGSFAFANLPEGDYQVIVQKGSHQTIAFAQTQSTVHLVLDEGTAPATAGAQLASMNAMQAPDDAKEELEKGKRAFLKRDFEAAQKHFAKALRKYPIYAAAQAYLAALLSTSEPDRSVQLATDATHNDPDNALAHLVLAAGLNNRKQLERGLTEADQALQRAPMVWQAHFERGRSLAGLGRLEEALASMTRADEYSNQQLYRISSVRAQLLEMLGRHTEARSVLSSWMDRNPTAPERAQAQDALLTLGTVAKR